MADQKLLYVIGKIKEISGESPCKKKVQKIVYLIENKSDFLDFPFRIHYYGPYSAQLDSAVLSLFSEGFVEFEYQNLSHKVKPVEQSEFSQIKGVDEVIELFAKDTPSKLELLTTSLYVVKNIIDKKSDLDAIIENVKKIKGTKYNNDEIKNSVLELKEFGFLN